VVFCSFDPTNDQISSRCFNLNHYRKSACRCRRKILEMSRQGAVVTGAMIVGISGITAWSIQTGQAVLSAAFWFEPVTYDASEAFAERLGITRAELSTIEASARAEVQAAFANSRLTFAD
jgi:hypothetical protein